MIHRTREAVLISEMMMQYPSQRTVIIHAYYNNVKNPQLTDSDCDVVGNPPNLSSLSYWLSNSSKSFSFIFSRPLIRLCRLSVLPIQQNEGEQNPLLEDSINTVEPPYSVHHWDQVKLS